MAGEHRNTTNKRQKGKHTHKGHGYRVRAVVFAPSQTAVDNL